MPRVNYCSCRGPVFSSQHPPGGPQPSITNPSRESAALHRYIHEPGAHKHLKAHIQTYKMVPPYLQGHCMSNYMYLLPEIFVAHFYKLPRKRNEIHGPLTNACFPLRSGVFRSRHGNDSPYLFCRVSQRRWLPAEETESLVPDSEPISRQPANAQ